MLLPSTLTLFERSTLACSLRDGHCFPPFQIIFFNHTSPIGVASSRSRVDGIGSDCVNRTTRADDSASDCINRTTRADDSASDSINRTWENKKGGRQVLDLREHRKAGG